MPLQVFKGNIPKREAKQMKSPDSLLGKTVFWNAEDGVRLAGVVDRRTDGSAYVVRMAVPNDDGILLVTDASTILDPSLLEVFNGISSEAKVKRFDACSVLEQEEIKMTTVLNEDKMPVDYRDVSFEGFASTFAEKTPRDRDGDYIIPGAFTKTIKEFMKNPIMLIDHRNSVREIAGSYSKVVQTKDGLAVQGRLSNAPNLSGVRFLIAEKHLKTLSIGGIFYFAEDGRGVQEVNLFEISLVAVPANPDALVQVRSITLEDHLKMFKSLARAGGLHFKTK